MNFFLQRIQILKKTKLFFEGGRGAVGGGGVV